LNGYLNMIIWLYKLAKLESYFLKLIRLFKWNLPPLLGSKDNKTGLNENKSFSNELKMLYIYSYLLNFASKNNYEQHLINPCRIRVIINWVC